MDRKIIYPGAVPLETDLLETNRNVLTALAKLTAAMFGTGTIVNGLGVAQTAVASMQVQVSAGEIYQLANLDSTAYSSLAADTTHQIVKQGISLDAQLLTCAAPGSVGFSINYLIQATFTESDTGAVVLPYYNSSNPSTAYSGPANAGTTNNTRRQGLVSLSAKAGVAATTGTQLTPSTDSGYVGLAVVTVAYGAASITNSNISAYAASPVLPANGLLNSAQQIAVAAGTSDAITANFTPAPTSLTNGLTFMVRANLANTTTTPTFAPNGLTAKTIVKGAGSALAVGDIAGAGHWIELQYDITLAQWVLQNPATGVTSGNQYKNIQPITSSVSANALTVGLNPTMLDFRSATLSVGVPNTRSNGSAISLVVPSGATLGTISATQARLVLIAIDNAGTMELAIANLAGGNNLDETTLISTTAISAAATSASIVYSTTARANVPFRVVGYLDITETTAGTWATDATTKQGMGGQALAAMSSAGFGQSWQAVTRVFGTTYYNTTGKEIKANVIFNATGAGTFGVTIQVGPPGALVSLGSENIASSTSGYSGRASFTVPPGHAYVVSANASTLTSFQEER